MSPPDAKLVGGVDAQLSMQSVKYTIGSEGDVYSDYTLKKRHMPTLLLAFAKRHFRGKYLFY